MREEVYNTDARFLNGKEVTLSRDDFGKLHLRLPNGEEYDEIRIVRSFPHSAADEFISFTDSSGREIGLIESLHDLRQKSCQVAAEELQRAYFCPEVRRIEKVTTHHGATTWHLVTDRGKAVVHVRERTDVRWLSGDRVVITDIHGIRYEIASAAALDAESRALLEQEG